MGSAAPRPALPRCLRVFSDGSQPPCSSDLSPVSEFCQVFPTSRRRTQTGPVGACDWGQAADVRVRQCVHVCDCVWVRAWLRSSKSPPPRRHSKARCGALRRGTHALTARHPPSSSESDLTIPTSADSQPPEPAPPGRKSPSARQPATPFPTPPRLRTRGRGAPWRPPRTPAAPPSRPHSRTRTRHSQAGVPASAAPSAGHSREPYQLLPGAQSTAGSSPGPISCCPIPASLLPLLEVSAPAVWPPDLHSLHPHPRENPPPLGTSELSHQGTSLPTFLLGPPSLSLPRWPGLLDWTLWHSSSFQTP